MSRKSVLRDAVKNVVAGFPRCHFVHLPTPLQEMKALSQQLGINLWVKRDDLTGLAMGGNKGRKLEFVMADAMAQGADSIVTWAGVQSNWCCQLAAAARKCGIQPILILFKRPGLPAGVEGNVLLDTIYGAEIHLVDLGDRSMMELESVRELVETIVERERKAGRKCYLAPIGASMTGGSMSRPLGAIGFLNAAAELLEQADARNFSVDSIVFATGSGSMQAGLIAGSKALRPEVRNIGISVSDARESMVRAVETISGEMLEEMPVELRPSVKIASDDIIVFDDYIDQGYGVLNNETMAALQMMARTEGLMLDPVYSSRAFAGMLDLLRKGYFRRGEHVVFLHTGGMPALFAYGADILEILNTME
jgi:L-cysteate sulfo-lyase